MNENTNKVLARQLTESGEEYFSKWFSNNNAKMSYDFDSDDLKELKYIQEELSEIIEPNFYIEKKPFGKKRKFGAYIDSIFEKHNVAQKIKLSDSFWNWVTVFYFEELRNERSTKSKYMDYYVKTKHHSIRGKYRQILKNTWLIHNKYPHLQVWGSLHLGEWGELNEQTFANSTYRISDCWFELVNSLYYDEENDKPYVGTADKGSKGIQTGSIVNLAPAMEIIGRKYNLNSLNLDQLIDIMVNGSEHMSPIRWFENSKSYKRYLDKNIIL